MTQRLLSELGEIAGLQSPRSRHRPESGCVAFWHALTRLKELRRHGIQRLVAVEPGRVIGPLDQ